jgi:DNA-binding Lrp family transcriptional regulator
MTSEILALLEEGPQDHIHLADLLRVEPRELRGPLKHLKTTGQIKRTGIEEKWALASYTAPQGRRQDPDPPDLTASIIAFLAEGPKSALSISTAFGWGRTTTQRRLTALVAEHAIKRVGKGRTARWALPGYVPPAVEAKAPAFAHGRTPVHPATKLRQAGPAASVSKDIEPSWWVGASRTGWSEALAQRQIALRESVAAKWVPLRLLQ